MNRFAAKEEEDVKLQSLVACKSNSLITQTDYPSYVLFVGLFLHYMAAECIQTYDKPRFLKAQ